MSVFASSAPGSDPAAVALSAVGGPLAAAVLVIVFLVSLYWYRQSTARLEEEGPGWADAGPVQSRRRRSFVAAFITGMAIGAPLVFVTVGLTCQQILSLLPDAYQWEAFVAFMAMLAVLIILEVTGLIVVEQRATRFYRAHLRSGVELGNSAAQGDSQ